MISEPGLILLSAGGTGGHMFPAAALAGDLKSRGYRVAVITDSRGLKFEGSFHGAPFYVVSAGTLGAGALNKVRGVVNLGRGLLEAMKLTGKLRPAVIVGFGGYPSVPGVYAGQRRGIPTVIHEQNAVLGKANAFLAHKAARIALSLPRAEGLDNASRSRAVVTGNPVREEIAALYTKPYPVLQRDGVFRIFTMGGSLGAKVFSDVVPDALARLPEPLRRRLDVVQQCRAEDMQRVREHYQMLGIRARLESFFSDVPEILARSHLVISRSGASTVAEVTAAGRPAIFVPYPHHADQQQRVNADTVADVGGAWVMTESGFTAEALQMRLEILLQNPEMLFRTAEAARTCARPDAARRLGNLVMEVEAGWDGAGRHDPA